MFPTFGPWGELAKRLRAGARTSFADRLARWPGDTAGTLQRGVVQTWVV